MTVKLSTGLRNLLAGDVATRTDGGSELAFVNSTARLTDTTSSLLTDGFRPGDVFLASGTDGGTNDLLFSVTSVASDGAYMVISPAPTDEAAAAAAFTITAGGKSIKEALHGGVIRIYSGSAPADADAVETGTLLLEITASGGTVTPGTVTNGLLLGTISSGAISKSTGQTWQGDALADGTAGYYRFYDNARVAGASTTSIRLQGTVATSGADLNVSTTSIVTDGTSTISAYSLTVRAS